MFNLVFTLWAIFMAILFFLSFNKVHQNKDKVVYIFQWGFPFGAFVWEDLLIFSLLYFIFALIALVSQDLRLWLLFMIVFWIVRSAGEAIYYFLQQFSQPVPYPHDHTQRFNFIRKIFGDLSNQQCFIILQIFAQSILTLFAASLILLLQNWNKINPLF